MIQNIKFCVVVVAAVCLAGCNPPPEGLQDQKPIAITLGESSGIQVTRVSTFRDDLAYGGYRGIYIIKDVKAGYEFIGVSGIGISENGSRQSGKTTRSDER
jgi:hypothetical protein